MNGVGDLAMKEILRLFNYSLVEEVGYQNRMVTLLFTFNLKRFFS